MPIRNLFLLAGVLSLTACQLFQPQPEPEPEPLPPPLPEAMPGEPEDSPLSRAIDYLQDGEGEKAEGLLERFLDENPGHGMAGKLLDQIRQSPESYLGTEEYYEVTVQPGDSLSDLAAEHLGDGLLFYALARFNGIEQPRLLQPGSVLRIPEAEAAAAPDADSSLQQTATGMRAGGRPDKAFTLLLSAARAGGLSPEGKQQLIDLATRLSEQALDAGRLQQAANMLEQTRPFVDDVEKTEQFEQQRNRVASRQKLDAAKQADEAVKRRELLLESVELDPEWEPARTALAETEAELVEHYHDRALTAWRDQEIETAAELWEQVLEIDPEFEPAEIYLERARDVLRRLEDL